jgi:hypothetical protein
LNALLARRAAEYLRGSMRLRYDAFVLLQPCRILSVNMGASA